MIVLWRVTERCNLACGFCAYDRTLSFVRRQTDIRTVERISGVLADYVRATGDRILVSWLGGEPLLWPPVFEASRHLRALGIAVSATTNGTTLSHASVRSAIVECLSELTVSVDGPAPLHETLRGWRGGWARLRDGVRALAAERRAGPLKLRANVVLMRDNLALFDDLCEELCTWGIDEITFNQLGGRERPEFFPAHRLRREDASALCDLVPVLRERLASRGVRLCASPEYLRRIGASAADESIAVGDCGPGERLLFIDERGRVAPCSFTSSALGVPLDAVRSAGDLLRLPAAFRAKCAQARPASCGDCPSTHVFAKFAT